MWLYLLLVVLLTAVSVRSQQSSIYSCDDPLKTSSSQQLLWKAHNTTICLYVGPSGNWNSDMSYKRFTFNVIADEFSNYRIPGSFQDIVQDNPFGSQATHIFASSQSSLSFLRRYYDTNTQYVYPYLTIVIDVREGIIRGIAWDDACVFCQKSRCLPDTYNFDGTVATEEQIQQPVNGCYLTRAECASLHTAGSTECDLRLYVVWTGTDSQGRVLLSSDSRFSAFPPDRIQESVKEGVDAAFGGIKNITNIVADFIPGMGG